MRLKVWVAGTLVVACAGVAAAIMVPQTTADLVNHSTLVVTGEVMDITTTPPDGSGTIYSLARVRVEDTVVGATADDIVTVRWMGGQYGDLAMVVEDQPMFRVGEEVVLFLVPTSDGHAYKCADEVQSKKTVVDGTVLPDDVSLHSYLADITAAAGH